MTRAGTQRALQISHLGDEYTPVCQVLDERAYVNGIVGLHATGGSTNLLIHLVAMARAGGIILDWQDFSDLAEVTPLLARVYPNGLADVNHFHAAGGLGFMIGQLLGAGLLHNDVTTVAGAGLERYTQDPKVEGDSVAWHAGPKTTLNDKILRPVEEPFQPTGGLQRLHGTLGSAVTKVSAVKPEFQVIEAPVRVFHTQESVKAAYQAGEFTADTIVVVRFQGPKANGMPELHSLTPVLANLQAKGLRVALVTDGRMSGASGKVLSAIHVCPEAVDGGPIARLRDGDVVRVDAVTGDFSIVTEGVLTREPVVEDLSGNEHGQGRDIFANFRRLVGSADTGASCL